MNNRNELLVVQDGWEWNEKDEEHELKYPFYTECYMTGLKSIFQNALAQEEREWRREKEKQKRIIADERNNIYSFIGKRGSGKTTAMDEFCRILCSMDRDHEFYSWWLERVMPEEQRVLLERKRFKFHVLKPIDASLFGEDEDLFEQVMVNIYDYFNDYIEEQRSEIMRQFSDIMKSYYSIRDVNENRNSDFSIANMLTLSSDTQSMQRKIAELIDKFLMCKKECNFEYIVIVIDDLDLNIEHGYQMVEQIQKYFAYHKIIVLISMDYDQMRIVFEQNFSQKLIRINETNGQKIGQRYVCGLSKDTMTKIFHISQRMYMPDFERLLKNTQVVTVYDLKKSGNDSNKEEDRLSIKYYLFGKIAHYMHIYYDICGMKKHFAEPETMREFVIYNEFLNSLEHLDFSQRKFLINEGTPLENENMDILKQYDLNYKRFEDDIFERMAQNLLTPVQREAFRNLYLRDIERRAKYFVNSYRKDDEIIFGAIDEEFINENSMLNKLLEGQKLELQYSYGRLIEHIYEWGRKSWNGSFEDKPYIWCILASFTAEMTRTYLNYCYNPDPIRRKEKYERRLLAFIGESFGNKWLGESFPRFQISKTSEVMQIRGYADAVANLMMIDIDIEGTTKLSFEEWVVKNHYIEIMGVLNMFFGGIDGNKVHGLDFVVELGIPKYLFIKQPQEVESRGKSNRPHITAVSDSAIKFDVMTFVLQSLNYKEARENIIENIVKVLCKLQTRYYGVFKPNERKIRNFVKKCLNELGIYTEVEYKVAFPFYNLDMSYNICKRLRKKFKNDFVRKSFIEALKDYYGEIIQLLEKEKNEYKICCEALKREDVVYENLERDFELLYNFENCPFINAILKKEINEDIMNQVEKNIRNMTIKVEQKNEAENKADN